MRILIIALSLTWSGVLQAQHVLTLQENASIYIQKDGIVALDGLVLVPSENYDLTGTNALTKGVAITFPASGIHINRVYTFANSVPAFTGSLWFKYHDDELNGLAENGLTLNAYNASWSPYTAYLRDAVNKFVETEVNTLSFQETTLASMNSSLPLQWLDIAAALRTNNVQVDWKTKDEYNVAGFYVEKQVGDKWEKLSPLLPARNTPGPNEYNYVDVNFEGGISYYRVQQVDLDGKNSYSAIVNVRGNPAGSLAIYPNPVSNYLTIKTNRSGVLLKTVTVLNTLGAVVELKTVNKASYQLPVQRLPKGTYVLQLQLSDGTISYSKFITE